MKVQPWHLGCIIILVLAAVYFLVGTREGLDNSSTCWDMVDGGVQDPVTNETRFVSSASFNSFMTKQMSNLPAIKSCFGESFPSPGTQPTPSQLECLKKATGSYSSLDEAKAACASDSSCTAIISSPAGGGTYAYSKFSEDATIVPTGGARYPDQKVYVKKPCANPSTSSPLPPGPAGTAGGAIMSPPPVVPASSSSGAPTYNFTCTASPVSGMLGSAAAMPEAPPAWNINQPSQGWNSKYGYANDQTSETSGGMAGGITSGMMAGVSPTSPNIGHGEWKDHKELSRSAAGMGMSTPPPPPPPPAPLPPAPLPPPAPLRSPPPPSAPVPVPASVSAASSVPASVPAGAAAK